MKSYKYTGISRNGERIRGSARATSETELELRLARSDIDIIDLREERQLSLGLGRKRVPLKELVSLTLQLQQLLSSGLSLMDVLNDLAESTENPHLQEIVSDIHEQMEGGRSFSQALEAHPRVFDQVYVHLVRVGEESGNLEHTLAQLADMKKWQDELQAKAKKIMVYPSILLLMISGVFIFMMTFVVPEIVTFVQDMGGEIGGMTKALIATSNYMVDYWYTLFLVPMALYFGLKFMLGRSEAFQMVWDRFKLRVPLFGPIIRKIKLARMANTIAVMYASGISLPDTLKMVRNVLDNSVLERAMDRVSLFLNEGRSVHESFQLTNEFPSLVVKMVKVGENSGKMDEAMLNISYFYDREAKEAIDRIEPAIEPLLTLAMAIIIGWVMMAVLGPIYDIITKI
ncbi:type II secretion system F family protein [Marinobacterium arenosum]|uniref:type II secretion system F family protein n=1 Tax=Marinobacterium arenosum TaxID=2862496 RepID=UPI001C96E79C|nr:type II secretion system F family protein [Marinobacterium arenosum]MBY4676529.1 type II secretion system F family protein [Marinobacterium arenosum]